MNELQTNGNKNGSGNGNECDIASSIHLEFIQNIAVSNDGSGVEEVEAYHRAIFLNHCGKDMERHEQNCRIHEDRLEHLENRLRDTQKKLAGLDKLVPVDVNGRPDVQPTAPWNNWDRVMFALALCGIVSMLVFGVFNISFNLLESGIVTFLEHPIRAYFWAALLPVGALAVKVGWDLLQDQRRRQVYQWACLAIGLVGVLTWLGAYAAVYPTLSKTTGEHIESLTVFDSGGTESETPSGLTVGGAKQIDMIIVAAQAVSEICLSAVLGIFMTIIYLRHRPVRLAENPAFVQLDQERELLESGVSREREAFADARGNKNRMDHQLSVFVAFAKTLYQKEVALRRDQSHQKRKLLNKIEEQLREEFDSVRNRDGADADPEFRQLSIDPRQAQSNL